MSGEQDGGGGPALRLDGLIRGDLQLPMLTCYMPLYFHSASDKS